jgi:hypothetical protein
MLYKKSGLAKTASTTEVSYSIVVQNKQTLKLIIILNITWILDIPIKVHIKLWCSLTLFGG